MKVIKIEPQGFAANTYLLTADGKTCVLIDCAQERVYDRCRELKLEPKYVLLTHCHYDHIGGCGLLYEKGAGIYLNEAELPLLFGPADLSEEFGAKLRPFRIAKTLKDGETFTLCGIRFTAVATPGHTAGGMCYIAEDCLFTGDTLFYESVGRTDFPTGDYKKLCESVKKLYALAGDYTVYCGHEQNTTLSHERAFNPYVR